MCDSDEDRISAFEYAISDIEQAIDGLFAVLDMLVCRSKKAEADKKVERGALGVAKAATHTRLNAVSAPTAGIPFDPRSVLDIIALLRAIANETVNSPLGGVRGTRGDHVAHTLRNDVFLPLDGAESALTRLAKK